MISVKARILILAALFLCALTSARAQFWQVDPTFTPPAIEEALFVDAGGVTPLSDNSLIIWMPAPILNGQIVGPLVHLKLDGSIDPNFTPPAVTYAQVLHAYPDSRLLVLASVNDSWSLMRLLANGTIDSSFAAISMGYAQPSVRVAIQPDNKILLYAGSSVLPSGQKIRRLNSDGSSDSTFSSSLLATSGINDVTCGVDGKLLLAGSLNFSSGSSVVFARLDADGSQDPTFSDTTGISSPGYWCQPLPDGRILFCGQSSSQLKLVRTNPEGTVDSSFVSGLPTANVVSVAKPLQSGPIYFVTVTGSTRTLRRLNAAASLDTSFDITGAYNQYWGPSIPITYDGTVLYFGPLSATDYSSRRSVVQTNASGSINPSFSIRASHFAMPSVMARQADGKYLLAALTDYVNNQPTIKQAIFRLNANGSFDTTFHQQSVEANATTDYLAVLPDGSFVFRNGTSVFKCNADGSLVSQATFTSAMIIALDGSGDIYARPYTGGTPTPILRYHADGTQDTTFNAPSSSDTSGVFPTSNGKILVTKFDQTTARLNHDGTADATFPSIPGQPSAFPEVAPISDGSALILFEQPPSITGEIPTAFTHYDVTGKLDYSYNGTNDLLIIAGVMFDVVRSASLSNGSAFLRLQSYGQLLDVRSNGQASIVQRNDLPLVRYIRTSLTSPSVPPANLSITTQPQSQETALGATVQFTVTASGAGPIAYQWLKNGSVIPGATNSVLQLTSVGLNDAGAYTVTVSNGQGSVTSNVANLTVRTAPSVTQSPVDATAPVGSAVVFSVAADVSVVSYQWQARKAGTTDWVNLTDSSVYSGVTTDKLSITATSPTMSGDSFRVIVSNASGQTVSAPATLVVTTAPKVSRLVNISTRAYVGTGEKVEIAGFIISGSQPKQVVIRALGPALTQFGVSNILDDPVLTLFSGQTQIASSDDWSSDATSANAIETLSKQMGLLALPRGSKDSVLVTTLAPGGYTAIVSGKADKAGVALVEVYEVDQSSSAARLVNISTRSETRSGGEIQIAGFIVAGDQPKRLLIRAAGPALAPFSVPNFLDDPALTLFSGQTQINQNDDWSSTDASATSVDSATKEAHAFDFAKGSKDAALAVTLAPGAYTAQVTAKSGRTGITLIEVYELP